MTQISDFSLADTRHTLRRRMLAQRQLIAYQLAPVPSAAGGYPRSRVVRYLADRPMLVAGLLASLATLLAGTRFVKPLIAVLAMTKILRATR